MNQQKLQALLDRVLSGETVTVGVFSVYEDFVYRRQKDANGTPLFDRVISLVYFDEEEDDSPSRENFDGTLESFKQALEAHDAFEGEDEDEDDDDEG